MSEFAGCGHPACGPARGRLYEEMSKYGQMGEDWRFAGLGPFSLLCAMSNYVSENGWRA